MTTNWDTVDMNRLIKALLVIETPNVMRCFLENILTNNEIIACTNKLKTALMLSQGAPYSFIQNETGLSPKVVAQISKKLRDKRGGYREVLKRLNPHGRRYFD